MPRKRHSAEEIVAKLRQADVLLAQGQTGAEVARALGVTETIYRDDLLNGEIFYSLREAQVVIEQWRWHYNSVRPHSSLGYRTPAPEIIMQSTNETVAQRPPLN
jgi:transposase InsO family protein